MGTAEAVSQPPNARRLAANAASVVVLAVEAIGSLMMWAPIPLIWFWVGARAYEATGSILVDGGVVLFGSLATIILAMAVLVRVDKLWINLRRRAGHDQSEGALTKVVVVSFTLGLALFQVWFIVVEKAYVLPFMPSK